MDSAKPLRVTIFHQQYTLAASDDAEQVEALAREVDDLMVTIARQSGLSDPSRVAVMASLHLADKLRQADTDYKKLRSKVGERTRRMSSMLAAADA